jgi:xanthine dehydrogenase accessory factor
MSKAIALWRFIAKHLRAQKPVMLLIVAESKGSSPGRQGFKMAVTASGELCGSIGGGIMEVKLVELARERLQKQEAGTLVKKQFHHKDSPQNQSGMICSGEQTLLFFPMQAQHLKLAREMLQCLQSHCNAVLQVRSSSITMLETSQREACFYFEQTGEQDWLFEEKIGFQHRLYIFGAGHCALALSELMSRLGFYICLFDDRPGLSTAEQNTFAHEKHLLPDYAQAGAHVPEGDNVYVVIMTLGYRSDETVLRKLLSKNVRYLGLLGSAKKVETLFEKLRADNIPAAALNKVHAPIGLKINSQTPEEIAVSIAGEIVLVMRDER